MWGFRFGRPGRDSENPSGHTPAHAGVAAREPVTEPVTQPLSKIAPQQPATSTPGKRVLAGRYELQEFIGRGGMSTVYRCSDRRTGREVAVKVFRTGTDLIDTQRRYRREVKHLSALHDPGLVSVLDAGLDNGGGPELTPYLVTELVRGPTLSQRIRHAPLTEDQVARLGAALSATLAYVHDHGIVHRDVKPSNIVISGTGEDDLAEPKLVDFGIAIANEDTRLTSEDLTVGTANYVSPEQLRGESVTPASDIYSLGLVLIEALTGERAYPGGGIEAALARLNRQPTIPRTTSPDLRAALTDMTAPDPADRPDARSVATRLEEVASADGVASLAADIMALGQAAEVPPVPRSGPARRAPRRARLRTIVVAALAAAVAVLAGIATVIASSSDREPVTVEQTPQDGARPHDRQPAVQISATPRRTVARPVTSASQPAPPPVITSEPPSPAAATPSSRATSRPPSTPAPAKTATSSPSAPPTSSAQTSPTPSASPPTSATSSTAPTSAAPSPPASTDLPSPTGWPLPTGLPSLTSTVSPLGP